MLCFSTFDVFVLYKRWIAKGQTAKAEKDENEERSVHEVREHLARSLTMEKKHGKRASLLGILIELKLILCYNQLIDK